MLTDGKVTRFIRIVHGFCLFFDAQIAKYVVKCISNGNHHVFYPYHNKSCPIQAKHVSLVLRQEGPKSVLGHFPV